MSIASGSFSSAAFAWMHSTSPSRRGFTTLACSATLCAAALAQSSTVFVGSSTSGSTDRHYFVNAASGTILSGGASGFTDNVTDAVWADFGTTLFVSQSSQTRISTAQWNGTTATWSALYVAPAACYGLGFDRANLRLWVLVGSGSSELHCVDVDVASPNYGQRVAETTVLAGPIREKWELAPSGRYAAVPQMLLQGGTLDFVDTDPASPTFTQITSSLSVPEASSMFSFAADITFSRDGRYLWLLFTGSGYSRVAVLDTTSMSWLDFGNSTGSQSLLASNIPGNSIAVSPDGLTAVISAGSTVGQAVRIALDPQFPANSLVTEFLPGQAALPRAHGASMSPDGARTTFSATPGNLVGPSYLATLDTTTGALLSYVQLPNIWNVYTTSWIEECVPPISYCTSGTSTSGCNATLNFAGIPSASAHSGFTLNASSVEGGKQGLIFYSLSGRANAPWGASSSFLCVKSPTQRTATQLSGGTIGQCDGTLQLDWNNYTASMPTALGVPFSPGAVVQAQAWFRDPPSPKTTTLSNALEFVVCP